jgi:outer membrane protein assembly factor BamC
MTRSSTVARCAAVASLCLGLAACGVTEKIDEASRIDYRSSTKLPSLEVPPDLTKPRADNRFTIPERASNDRTWSSFERNRATPSAQGATQVLPQVAGAHIEREADQRWLVVDAPPEKVWPVVRDFWRESGFTVESESPQTGVIETDWAENHAKLPLDFIRRTVGRAFDNIYSTGERDKFRTRLEREPGGGTAVYITHRGMVEVYTSTAEERTVWQPRPSDPGLEAEFLRRLMLRFVPDADATLTAQGASTDGAAQSVTLVNSGEAQRLELPESFDRAWRRVGLALDRGGFTVEDRDRSKGVYFVRYIDPEIEGGRTGKKPGFLARIFGSGQARADASPRFRIEVTSEGEGSQVLVRDPQGQPVGEVDRKTVGRILSLLQEQMK